MYASTQELDVIPAPGAVNLTRREIGHSKG